MKPPIYFVSLLGRAWMIGTVAVLVMVPLHAQVILFDNFTPGAGNSVPTGASDGSQWLYNDSGLRTAEQFKNSNASALQLTSVTLGLQLLDSTDPTNFSLNLYSDSGGQVGSLIQTLTTGTSSISSNPTAITFAAPAGITLAAGTSYWIEMQPNTLNTSDASNNNNVAWYISQSSVISNFMIQRFDASGAPGFDIYGIATTGPDMIVDAAPIPEPSTWTMLVGGLGLMLVFRRRLFRAGN